MTRTDAMSPHPRKGSANRRHSSGAEQQPLTNGRPVLHPQGVVAMAMKGMSSLVSSPSPDLHDKAAPRGTSSHASSHDEGTYRSDDQVPLSATVSEDHPPEFADMLATMADLTRQVQELSDTMESYRRDSQAALESIRGDVLYTAERTRENTKNEVMQLAERINAVSHLLAKERSVREATTSGVEKQIRTFCEKLEDSYRQDIVKLGDRLSKVASDQQEVSDNLISSELLSRLGDVEERCSSLETRVLDKKLAAFSSFGDPWISGERPEGDDLQHRIASMEAMAKNLRERKCLEPAVVGDSLSLQPTATTGYSSPTISARVLPATRMVMSRSQSVERQRGFSSPHHSPVNSLAAPTGSASISAPGGSPSMGSAVAPSSVTVKMNSLQPPLSRPQDLGFVHSPPMPVRLTSVQMQSLAEVQTSARADVVESATSSAIRPSSSAASLNVMDVEQLARPMPEVEGENAPLRVLLSPPSLTRVISPAQTHRALSSPENTHRNVLGVAVSSGSYHGLQMRQMPRTPGVAMANSLQPPSGYPMANGGTAVLSSARTHNSQPAAKQSTSPS